MSRAALLPTPGDPVILTVWLDLYRKVWHKEVDRLYVQLNTHPWVPMAIQEWNIKQVLESPNACVVAGKPNNHGQSLRDLTLLATEDLVAFVEDDGLIFRPGIVDQCFKRLEDNTADIVGSPRGSCSPEICTATDKMYCFEGDEKRRGQPNWWPNFFFTKREHLLATDLNFDSKGWAPGELVEHLRITAPHAMAGDTFVWGSIQLRAMGLRDAFVEQYHSYPHDLELKDRNEHLWDGRCPWLHIGSLSVTMGANPETSLVSDNYRVPVSSYMPPGISEASRNATQIELARRFAWITLLAEHAYNMEMPSGIKCYVQRYMENINTTIQMLSVDVHLMSKLKQAYRGVLTW